MIKVNGKEISAITVNGKTIAEAWCNGELVWSGHYEGSVILNTFGDPSGWQIFNNDITIQEVD